MSVCAATTWYPRGEIHRFERFLPKLLESYASVVIILAPSEDHETIQRLSASEFTSKSRLIIHMNEHRRSSRYKAIKHAIATSADHIHYVDMDRLLHWVETQPQEWEQSIRQIEKSDCIVFGRTQAAYMTHPEALRSTELTSNMVVSSILGCDIDVSAGSKSFSRPAAQFLIDHGASDNSIGSDAEWPILLKRAGFTIDYVQVNGLAWESADRYLRHAAPAEVRTQAARDYDASPTLWLTRVEIANEIIQAALTASQKKIPQVQPSDVEPVEFDLQAVFDVEDYMYFYSEALTDERTDKEVSAMVSLLGLNEPMQILDLACGFGRHTNRLATLGHHMTGIDLTEGFLDIARQDAAKRGVKVRYLQGDMRKLSFENEFDRVMLVFTAFGYFSDEENLQVLVNMQRALKPGGFLVFDIPNRDTYVKSRPPFFVVEKEGNLMIDRDSFDSVTGKSYNKRIVLRDGIRKDKPFSIRLYNPNEIKTMLATARLEPVHFYSGWDASELSTESRRLVVVARKPA